MLISARMMYINCIVLALNIIGFGIIYAILYASKNASTISERVFNISDIVVSSIVSESKNLLIYLGFTKYSIVKKSSVIILSTIANGICVYIVSSITLRMAKFLLNEIKPEMKIQIKCIDKKA